MRQAEAAGNEGDDAVVLQVSGLQVAFPGERGWVQAINGVTLSVRAGETLAVVGESGSGKSVTGMSVMRLIERAGGRIVGGSIKLRSGGAQRELTALRDADMAKLRGRDVAMIFQDPMSSLNPVFPIGDQIGEALRVHRGLSRRAAREAATELLAQVGLQDPQRRLDAFPHQLSGGMRQRVVLAIALACDPSLLIADEPTTALDVTVQAQIVARLAQLQRDRRMAMIFITHDLHLVGDIADRIAVMYAGQVVEEGPAAKILAHAAHPYTRALLACIPGRRGAAGSARLMPIPGSMPSPHAMPPGCRFEPRCRYARPDCAQAVPALDTVAAGHTTRCIHWQEVAA